MDAFLAEPRTQWQIDALKTLSHEKYRNIWLGATDQAVEGTWVWAQSGANVDGPTDWFPGEPNDHGSGEDCLEVRHNRRKGQWNDISCDQRKPFICQKEITPETSGNICALVYNN